eukprot:757560-Hanusia_phi.AAC.3
MAYPTLQQQSPPAEGACDAQCRTTVSCSLPRAERSDMSGCNSLSRRRMRSRSTTRMTSSQPRPSAWPCVCSSSVSATAVERTSNQDRYSEPEAAVDVWDKLTSVAPRNSSKISASQK